MRDEVVKRYIKRGINIDITLSIHKSFAIQVDVTDKQGKLLDGFRFEVSRLFVPLVKRFL